MSSAMSSWRRRMQVARTRRALNRAIDGATTPSMRNELIAIAATRGYYDISH